MKLQYKVFLSVAVCGLLIGVPAYIMFRAWLSADFATLEFQAAKKEMTRCAAVLENDLFNMAVTAEDWASWDDTWKFVQDRNQEYVAANLGRDSIIGLRINLLYIADVERQTVYSLFMQGTGDTSEIVKGSIFDSEMLPSDFPFLTSRQGPTVKGILRTTKGLLLLVSRPILKSDDTGPIQGTLIMGRLIDDEYINYMIRQTHLKLRLDGVPDKSTSSTINPSENDITIADVSTQILHASLLLRDVHNKPVGKIRATIFKETTARGNTALRFFFFAMLGIGLLFLALVHTVLYFAVVRRIKRLSKRVVAVDDTRSTPELLFPDGTDEIGSLTDSFNRLLARMDRSRQKKKMESLLALSGGVAHDLNNILGPAVALPELVIEELGELAQSHNLNVNEILGDLEIISASNRRAAQVIKDLSVMSSMGQIRKVPILPRVVVWEVLRSPAVTDAAALKPNIVLVQELNSRKRIMGAEGPLSRLVLNLVINAIESIKQSGTVTVTAVDEDLSTAPFPIPGFKPGAYFVLKVRDTGSGIEKQDLDSIFEPFFTRKLGFGSRGSGLGLAIVRGVVQDFSGYIHVESEVGRGTTFTILFQSVEEPEVEDNPLKRTSRPVSTLSSARILVVDDEEAQRSMARRILERSGYTVDTASDGEAALARIEAGEHYSLILLDMLMKDGFDGLDTYKAVRKLDPNVKVLVASGHAPSDRGAEIIALGAAWMSKPYTADTLITSIESLLKN